MNNKELAKLLLKHPLIKKINESQMWDKSVVSRVIAEELMAEQNNSQSIEDMKVAIELLNNEIDKMIAKVKELAAKRDYQRSLGDEADAEKTNNEGQQLVLKVRQKQVELDDMLVAYEKLKNKAAETPLTKDDEMVQTAAMQDAEEIGAVNKELPRQVATINNAKEAPKAAKQAVQQVSQALDSVSTDKVKKVAIAMANASSEQEPPQDKKDSKQLPSTGWVNPFNSLKRQITTKAKETDNAQNFFDQVLDSLSKQDSAAFFKLVAPTATKKDVKFQQALEVIEDTGAVREFQGIIDSLKQKPEVAVNQVMSYLGFLQELSKLRDETERFGEMVKGFTKQVAEKPEAPVEQTAKDFLQTIEKERGLATSDQLSGEDEAKRQEYIQIAESMISAVDSLKNNELLQNDLAKMFVGWWLMYNTKKTLQEGIVTDQVELFREKNKLTNEEVKELQQLFVKNKTSFDKLMADLNSIINPQSEEQKEQTKQYLVPLSKTEMPREILFKIAKEAGAEEEILKNLKIPSQEKPAEDETETKLLTGPAQEPISQEELQQDLDADVTKENQTPARVYNEQQYETLATFFADKGGKGLGFMQQLLLRRQSEQLQNLIKTLEDIIDPNKNQMKSLTRTPVNEQQEETQEPIIELESSQKRKLKSELLGLLSALKNLKTLSKAYEENMTRTSVDPRYDGSSLKARLDEMLPEIQNAIARILKMIQDFFGDLQKVEPNVVNEQQGSGLDREAKIDLVEDVYKKMRVIWSAMGPALQDTFKQEEPEGQPEPPSEPSAEPEGGSETQAENLLREKDASKATDAVVQNATDMKALATQKDFISLFPTIVFANGGEVVSIEQANKVLSGVISEFVYVMRNVVALVKGEQITQGTASEVKQKLSDIANAIEESFGIPAARIVKQIEKETAGDPESQSLTDTPANNNEFFDDDAPTGEPGGDLETDADEEGVESGINLPDPSGKLDKDDEDADASPFPVLGSGEDETGEDTSEDETKNLESEIDQLFKKVIGDEKLKKLILFPLVNQLRELEGNKLRNVEMQKVALGLLILFIKAQDRELVSEVEWDKEVAKMKGHIESINKYLKTSNIKNKEVYTRILRMLYTGKSPQLLNLFFDRTNPAKSASKRLRNKIKDIIDLKNIPSALRGSNLEEALKPIIAKMLKEHYG